MSAASRRSRERQTLTPHGQRKFVKDDNIRGFAVPPTVDTDKVQADYKNGVVMITLPKKEAVKPRQVKVAVQDGEAKTQ